MIKRHRNRAANVFPAGGADVNFLSRMDGYGDRCGFAFVLLGHLLADFREVSDWIVVLLLELIEISEALDGATLRFSVFSKGLYDGEADATVSLLSLPEEHTLPLICGFTLSIISHHHLTLHEIFLQFDIRNTHRHGRTDGDGLIILRNYGVTIRLTEKQIDMLEEVSGRNKPFRDKSSAVRAAIDSKFGLN